MDAALKAVSAHGEVRASSRRSGLGCTCRNENHGAKIETLRHRNRVAGNSIEIVNKSTTELRHRCESVYFAAAIFNDRRPADVKLHGAWLVPPFVGVLSRREFFDELSKSCVAVADARSVTEHRIERRGLTVVVHSDLLVALNGAHTASQT